MTVSLRICSAWQLISKLTDFLRSMKVLQGCVRKLLLTLVSFNTNRSVILHSPRENENAVFDRGRKRLSPSPPSEPCVRFSRTRLSSRWFPHRDWLASFQAAYMVNSPWAAKNVLGQR